MKSFAAACVAAALVVPSAASAVVSCPDRTPVAITSVGAAAVTCQKTIAKEGLKFVKTKMKVLGKCLFKEPVGSCIAAANIDAKISQTATKAAEKIAKQDRARFVEVVETELLSLHEGNIARYRLRPGEFVDWKKHWK